MELLLNREKSSLTCTIGVLFNEHNVSLCYILEDVVRAVKIPGKTAIPAGRYRIIINFSETFQRLEFLLLGVPGYVGIRVHKGNRAEDTEGCLIPGLVRGNNIVGNSKEAYAKIARLISDVLMAKEDVYITIKDGV